MKPDQTEFQNNEATSTSEDVEMKDQATEETPLEEVEATSDATTVEFNELKALAEENHQRFLRAQADFDNFRRRTLKEKEDLAKYASTKLVSELIPVLDNFERAITTNLAETENDSYAKGVDMIYRQFLQVMTQEGVTAMNAVGQPFNPELHQAIMQVESDEYEEGIVVEEVQKGYMLKDRVMRPAMVKVSM